MNVNAIKDAVKALAHSLQVPTIFPSSLLVLVNAYVVVPLILPDLDLSTPSAGTVMVSLTLLLSYTLYAFNFPLIRLFEGQKLRNTDLFAWLLKKQQDAFDDLYERLMDLRLEYESCRDYFDALDPDAHIDHEKLAQMTARRQVLEALWPKLERRFDRDYPSTRGKLLSTRLGNTIAAFEDYSRTRYGMESIVLWGRLVPVLKERDYLEFVAQEKAVFDFLMNTCAVIGFLGLEFTYLSLFLNPLITPLIIASTLVLGVVLYNGMVIAARQWGTTVRVAFDLYRHDLHQRLGLKESSSFTEERRRWEMVSEFLFCRREGVLKAFDESMPQTKLFAQGREPRSS